MNSMMLIAAGILRRTRWSTASLPLAFDAGAAGRPDDRRVQCARGQHHAAAGLHHELPTLPAQSRHQIVQRRHPSILEFELVKPRFLADCNVGRLARWLRALGYDASYHPRIDDAELVREAAAESRVLLTRDRDLTKRRVIQTGAVRAILLRDDEAPS